MATQIEADRLRYAENLISQLSTTHPDLIQKIVYGATHLSNPILAMVTTTERRAEEILDDSQIRANEASLLGYLEGSGQTLATVFRVQDGICETMKWEKPSIAHRLDLCVTACVAAATQRLHTYSVTAQEAPEVPESVYTEIGRRWNHMDSAAIYLDRAKHLQVMMQNPGASQFATTYITSFVDSELQQRLQKIKERGNQVQVETSKSMTEIGFPDDVVYELAVRILVESARTGTIAGNGAALWKMEDVLQWMNHETIRPGITAESIVRFISYAWMNKARNELSEGNYRNAFGDPIATKSQVLDTTVGWLNRANGFMTAEIPFLVDFNSMYDSDFKESFVAQISGKGG